MTPEAAATATADPVANMAAGFMTDMATYQRGGELGFDGIDFYIAGRGGALGDVAGEVVAATFTYFTTEVVVPSWDRARKVMDPIDAAGLYMAVGHQWGEAHLTDDSDLGRLSELLGTLIRSAPVSVAPLFAAWRAMPEPDTDRAGALVLHRMNVLRELRGALHTAAIVTHGLTPHEAVSIRQPGMLGLMGYPGPDPAAKDNGAQTRWAQAEAATDRAMGPVYAALDGAELRELCELLATTCAAVT